MKYTRRKLCNSARSKDIAVILTRFGAGVEYLAGCSVHVRAGCLWLGCFVEERLAQGLGRETSLN